MSKYKLGDIVWVLSVYGNRPYQATIHAISEVNRLNPSVKYFVGNARRKLTEDKIFKTEAEAIASVTSQTKQNKADV